MSDVMSGKTNAVIMVSTAMLLAPHIGTDAADRKASHAMAPLIRRLTGTDPMPCSTRNWANSG
jgi:hypothetical protein